MFYATRNRFIALASMLVLATACSDNSSNPVSPSAEPTLVSVEIAGKNQYVVGEVFQLKATAKYSDGTQRDVTGQSEWSNFTSGAIEVGPTTGLLRALQAGRCGVVAKFGGMSGTLSVVVVEGGPGGPDGPVTGFVVQGEPSVAVGQTTQWQAIAIFASGAQQNVTGSTNWSSNAPATASVAGGLITGVAPGTATIAANYQGRNATGSILVTSGGPAPDVQSLAITGNTSIPVGETSQLQAIATLSNGTTLPVTTSAVWTSSNPGSAPVVAGLVSGRTVGQAQITAAYGGQAANALVNVTPVAGEPPAGAISITGPACTAPGQTSQLTATVNGSNVTAQATWSSRNAGVASVSSSGAISCASPGTTTVTAALPPYTPGSINVTVSPGGGAPADLIGLELDVPVNLTVADVLNGDPVLGAKVFGLYSNGSRSEVTAACVSSNCLTSPTNLLNIDGMGTAEVVTLLLDGLLNPNHQVNATYGGYTANANVTLQLPGLNDVVIGNGGALGLNLTNNNQLPSLQTLFSQGITSTVASDAEGVDYNIALGGPLSAAIDALPAGAGATLRSTVLNPVLDTLDVVDGELTGNVGALNALLAALSANPTLAPLLGPGGAVPLDMTATLNGVTSDAVRLNLGN